MENDKPFECIEPGCGMSFANEDHLSVHQAKHAMSLALTSGSARPGSILTFVADQTPTPTKFLRNCEEMGLFHELSKNPFEEAFKKAAEESKNLDMHEQSSPFPVTSLDTESLLSHNMVDSLNTPTPHALESLLPSLTEVKSGQLLVTATSSKKSAAFSPLPGPDADTGSTLSAVSTSSEVLHVQLPPEVEIVNSSTNNTNNMLPVSVDDADSCGSFTTMTGASDHVASNNELQTRTPGVYYLLIQSPSDTLVPLHIPSESSSTGNMPVRLSPVPNTPTTSVPRKLLAVPRSIKPPVTLAIKPLISGGVATAALQSNCSARSSTVCDATTSSGIANSTKERLKAAIQQNSQVNVMHSNMKVMSDAVDWITANQSRVAMPTSDDTLPVSANCNINNVATTTNAHPSSVVVRIANQQIKFEDADTSTPKQLRLSTSDDDPEYRRQKFLERNRAAAARFRIRKKYLMSNLERRAEDVEKLNSSLQFEVGKLRKEVAQLKTMLIAHSDCPVTRLQRGLLAASQVHVVSGQSETEDDEAIAMAALSTLADSGTHHTENQLMSTLSSDSLNCTVAVDLSSNGVG